MAQATINRSTNYYTPRPHPSPGSYYTLHGLKQSAKLNGQLVKVHEKIQNHEDPAAARYQVEIIQTGARNSAKVENLKNLGESLSKQSTSQQVKLIFKLLKILIPEKKRHSIERNKIKDSNNQKWIITAKDRSQLTYIMNPIEDSEITNQYIDTCIKNIKELVNQPKPKIDEEIRQLTHKIPSLVFTKDLFPLIEHFKKNSDYEFEINDDFSQFKLKHNKINYTLQYFFTYCGVAFQNLSAEDDKHHLLKSNNKYTYAKIQELKKTSKTHASQGLPESVQEIDYKTYSRKLKRLILEDRQIIYLLEHFSIL